MRNNKRVIYTSSYDRGLEHLLALWPKVKEAVPEATLDIFYGWTLFDKFHKDNPSSAKWKERMLEMMKAPGVTEFGRVSQEAIAKEMSETGIWAYPTHFGEINCITALKAQAYGAIPVVVNYAALKTSVQFGAKVDGDIYDPEVKETFTQELIKALNKDWDRQEMMDWASKKFPWSEIAKHWDACFNDKPYEFWTDLPNKAVIVNGYTGKEESGKS